MLVGRGAHIRHVTFRRVEDVAVTWIDDYLRAALASAALEPSMGDGQTTIRVSKGPKRRPS